MAKFKLNDTIYVVDRYNLYITKGKIQSIKKTTYTHFSDYSNGGPKETTHLYQYSLHGRNDWDYSDHCFTTKKEAVSFAKDKLKEELQDINQKLSWLNS